MKVLLTLVAIAGILSCSRDPKEESMPATKPTAKTEKEWREKLTPEQYRICREKGTERPFTGEYLHFEGNGTYGCVACGNPLFRSDTKYDSGCGWPSFWDSVSGENVHRESPGASGVEVTCGKCGSHLGHLFDDGPKPTGLRY